MSFPATQPHTITIMFATFKATWTPFSSPFWCSLSPRDVALQHASCLNTPSCYSVISQSAICANKAGSSSSGLKSQWSGSISRLPVISLISCISPFVFLITPSSDHVQSLWKAPRGASNRRQPLSRRSVISLIPPPTVSCSRHSHRLRKGICAQAKRDFFFSSLRLLKTAFCSWYKTKMGKKKNCQLFYACSPLKASAEICLIIHPSSPFYSLI